CAIDTPAVAPKKAPARSRVTNGKVILPAIDGRSTTARRYRDLIDQITNDLGGPQMVSEGQRQLIRRAAMLSAEAERLEALACRNERVGKENWQSEKNCLFDVTSTA